MAYLGRTPANVPVTASDIPDNSITAAKILDGVITPGDLSANAVTTAKIAGDAVDGTKIADNAINSEHITAGGVDDAHLATGITATKLTGNLPAISGALLTNVVAVSGVATDATKLPLAGGALTGAVTTNSTFDGVDIATRDAILTSTTTTAGAALPKAGGTMTGNLITTNTTLDAYSKTYSDTCIDVFVYDTSKDSDGGAWRKRTQHTSWYNEAASGTRSSRKEFPSIAIIVLTTTGWDLKIYDGDDPALPLWKSFDISVGGSEKIWALNGEIWIQSTSTFPSLGSINFIKDWIEIRDDRNSNGTNRRFYDPMTAASVDGNSFRTTKNGVVGHVIRDIIMTVLPGAPIDIGSGLPTPTIAVATDDGGSIIKDDGTVVDLYRTSDDVVKHVSFTNHNRLVMNQGLGALYVSDIPTGDVAGNPHSSWTVYGSNSANAPTSAVPRYISTGSATAMCVAGDKIAIGATYGGTNGYRSPGNADGGLSILRENFPTTQYDNTGMVAIIGSDYNTGWMVGDCEGAYCNSTDSTNLVGSELVTNGTFASNITGWTDNSGSGSSISHDSTGGGRLSFSGSAAYALANQSITTVADKWYILSYDVKVSGHSSNNAEFWVGTGSGSGNSAHDLLNQSAEDGGSTGIKHHLFRASGTTTYFTIKTGYSALRIDDVSCKLAEPDRSVSGHTANKTDNGIRVHGTVTKSVVATGAELMAYSGFSSSNYLEQPSNTNLNFGAGSYSVMGWFKSAAGEDNKSALCIEDNPGNGQPMVFLYRLSDKWRWYTGTGSGSGGESLIDNTTVPNGLWTFLALVRTTTGRYIYANGVLENSDSTVHNFNHNSTTVCTLGNRSYNNGYTSHFSNGSMALVRISGTAPTAAQIKYIYEEEKPLFQENANCTLNGTADGVLAVAYDDTTKLLHAGTSTGRSAFRGLRRVEENTNNITELSAQGGVVVEEY